MLCLRVHIYSKFKFRLLFCWNMWFSFCFPLRLHLFKLAVNGELIEGIWFLFFFILLANRKKTKPNKEVHFKGWPFLANGFSLNDIEMVIGDMIVVVAPSYKIICYFTVDDHMKCVYIYICVCLFVLTQSDRTIFPLSPKTDWVLFLFSMLNYNLQFAIYRARRTEYRSWSMA